MVDWDVIPPCHASMSVLWWREMLSPCHSNISVSWWSETLSPPVISCQYHVRVRCYPLSCHVSIMVAWDVIRGAVSNRTVGSCRTFAGAFSVWCGPHRLQPPSHYLLSLVDVTAVRASVGHARLNTHTHTHAQHYSLIIHPRSSSCLCVCVCLHSHVSLAISLPTSVVGVASLYVCTAVHTKHT